MANTFTQIYIQLVFATKYRTSFIKPEWETDLYKYITGIAQNKGHKMIAINGMPDHIHIFLGIKPKEAISKIVQEVKANSSKWINQQALTESKFSWQSGFGAFSYSHSHISNVANYIANQKEHHKQKTFKHEYLKLLEKFEIEFEDEYLFEFYE